MSRYPGFRDFCICSLLLATAIALAWTGAATAASSIGTANTDRMFGKSGGERTAMIASGGAAPRIACTVKNGAASSAPETAKTR